MQPLKIPTERGNSTWQAPPPSREPTNGTWTMGRNQINHGEDYNSDSDTGEEVPEATAVKKSMMTAYLEQIFSKKF